MHLKPEDIRKAMENAKALGIVSDKKSKGHGGLMANASLVWNGISELKLEIWIKMNQIFLILDNLNRFIITIVTLTFQQYIDGFKCHITIQYFNVHQDTV